ncbi:SDR family oxidoreductase, partial [Klebsiella pneumoniae]|nr:SDR family oxidoreductase [Klebsiella pneumoniae]
LDVTDPAQVAAVRDTLGERWGQVDGALHAIGFAPPSCLGGGFTEAPWEDVAVALQISAYSLKTLADVVVPHMTNGGSI